MPRRRDTHRPPEVVGKAVDVVKDRPSESAAFLVIAAPAFGWLTEHGVTEPLAAVIALAAGFVPGVVSAVVDRLESRR